MDYHPASIANGGGIRHVELNDDSACIRLIQSDNKSMHWWGAVLFVRQNMCKDEVVESSFVKESCRAVSADGPTLYLATCECRAGLNLDPW